MAEFTRLGGIDEGFWDLTLSDDELHILRAAIEGAEGDYRVFKLYQEFNRQLPYSETRYTSYGVVEVEEK